MKICYFGDILYDEALVVIVSESIFMNLSHLVRELMDADGFIEVSDSTLLNNNYKFLSPFMRKFIEEMAQEQMNIMHQHLGQTYSDASKYLMIPESIREFVESGPSGMFVLGNRITEAVRSREALHKIHRLALLSCLDCNQSCSTCFLDKTRKILKEYNLIPFSG